MRTRDAELPRETQPEERQVDWGGVLASSATTILQRHWSRMCWRSFRRFIPKNCRALEIGCGTGRLINQASKHLGVEGVGVDNNINALEYARTLGQVLGTRCMLVQGSGFQLPFADNTFDLVFSEGVIEHFSRQMTDQMVKEHVRVAKPAGLVIVSVPNLLNLPLTYHKWRVGDKYAAYPERSYSIWGLAKVLKRQGLSLLAYEGFAPGAALEWYFPGHLRLHWLDTITRGWLGALIGFEILIVAQK
jgi:ubiquinone/menaquinone biosynthesis C-methylase UbiE